MRLFAFFVFTLISFSARSQNQAIDSLLARWNTETAPDQQQLLLLELAWEYSYSKVDSAKFYAIMGVELAKKEKTLRTRLMPNRCWPLYMR